MARLTRVNVRDVPGLPAVEVDLQPVTAIIGPRASGKSRLLAAISWLLTGQPDLVGLAGGTLPDVSANLSTDRRPRAIRRSSVVVPEPPLPSCRYLTARDRIAGGPSSGAGSVVGSSDTAGAEALVEALEADSHGRRRGEVLLIEEPELFLGPQAQRHLYRLLRRYARWNQVIYSTRSSALVDAIHHEEILRLDLVESGLNVRQAPATVLTDEERLRLAAEFDHERSEMFFARAVVLVEGETERISLPAIFRALGHDPDALGIAIVEVGGKGNLTLAARLLAELGIPHLVVFDADRGAAARDEDAAIRQAVGPAPVVRLDPDFEGVAGIGSHDEKVLHAWQRFHAAPRGRIPPDFQHIVEVAVRLASQESRPARS
jgi:Overcoming lysogenization defect protein-like, TOPRIM domain/AAA domain, putative AbiEii toxin, Type IV TA system